MSRQRIGWIAVGAVVGIVAAVVGNWWTAGAMVCLILIQVARERTERRGAAPEVESSSSPE